MNGMYNDNYKTGRSDGILIFVRTRLFENRLEINRN